jgi:asparagine N-glycosylation enzyme membrane subunit Stt3
MSEPRSSSGMSALALIPIACCVGIPLIAAAGISAAVAAWVGGIAIGVVVLVVVTVLLALHLRRRHDPRHLPSSILGGRS